GASASRTSTAENDTAVTPTMRSATNRRSTDLPAHARPRDGVTDRPGAPSPGAHLPREPFGGVGQRHDELGRRTRREEPFDRTHDADRTDRVTAMIEHRGGDLPFADHGLMRLGGEAGRRHLFE